MAVRKLTIEKTELEELYRNNSAHQIAVQLGVSDETVRKRLRLEGIPRRSVGGRRRFNPSYDELNALYGQYSMKQIAEKLGVGETVVFKRLKEHGIVLDGFEGGHRSKPGRKFTKEHRKNLSISLRAGGKKAGENAPNWQGGIRWDNLRARSNGAYREWRNAVLELAGNACQQCGAKGGHECDCCGTRVTLHVHHIESFAKNIDRRYDPTNGEVLCPKCHHLRHKRKSGELLERPKSRSTTAEPVTADVTV